MNLGARASEIVAVDGRAGSEAAKGGAEAQRWWDDHQRQLRDAVGKTAFRSWLSQLHPVSISEARIVLEAPSQFHFEQVNARLTSELIAMPKVLGRAVDLRVARTN